MDDNTVFCLQLFKERLCAKIVPVFCKEFVEIYKRAATDKVLLPTETIINNTRVAQYRDPILPIDFQNALTNVPDMNQTLVNRLYSKVSAAETEYTDNLIKAVIAYSTQLACISSNVIPSSIDVSIPDGSHFVHSAFLEVARRLWENPLLLHVEGMTSYQKYKQGNKFQDMIKETVKDEITRFVPTANILSHLNYGDADQMEDRQQQPDQAVDLRRQDLNAIAPSHFNYPPTSSQDSIYVTPPGFAPPMSSSTTNLLSSPSPLPAAPSLPPPPPATTVTTTTVTNPNDHGFSSLLNRSLGGGGEDNEHGGGSDEEDDSGGEQDSDAGGSGGVEQEDGDNKTKLPDATATANDEEGNKKVPHRICIDTGV